MTEPISPQRLAEIRDIGNQLRDPTPEAAERIRTELLAEVDRLTTALAELEELGIERHAEMLVDEVRLRSLEIRNGGFKMEMEEARDLAAIYVACARTMPGDAENYTETKISFDVKIAESPETYVLTVQRTEPGKLTPHEARQRAEAERDQARARVAELEDLVTKLIDNRETIAMECYRRGKRVADLEGERALIEQAIDTLDCPTWSDVVHAINVAAAQRQNGTSQCAR